MDVSFVTVYKMAEPVAQQMRNACTKRKRPPLVANSFYTSKSFGAFSIRLCSRSQHLMYAYFVQLNGKSFAQLLRAFLGGLLWNTPHFYYCSEIDVFSPMPPFKAENLDPEIKPSILDSCTIRFVAKFLL